MSDKPPLKIFTLGGLSIQRDDQPVSGFISRKVEALFVYLAVEQREHPREVLAELLWNDLTQARAMGNLRTALSNLQSQLADYLVVTRQTVMLDPASPYWIDALALEKAFNPVDNKRSPVAAHTLASVLDLYKGEFLAGFHVRDARGFEGWLALQAERMRGKVSEILQHLIRESLAQKTYSDGIGYARRLLALDPLAEETHRDLMRLLSQAGQRNAALAQYEACVRLLREELDVAPEAETTRLFAQLQVQHITNLPVTNPATRPLPIIKIPIPATPFIERPAELQQITELLDNPACRLVTIVGPGGMGKTRLAIQAAAERAHAFRDGVFFVSLISVQSGDFLPIEIASVLNFTFQAAAQPQTQLIEYLASRELLLILDNFDQLVGSANLLAEILTRAGRVKIMVTSREWLNLQQEWVIPIGGMTYPSISASDVDSYSAVQLFVACARRVRPRFSLDDEREAVVKICQLVEGMPLSIELAATWLRVISASEIVQEVNVNFLSTTARDIPERHRSARAVFAYSWQLLSPAEARTLRMLSVFKGSFDRMAATQVAAASILILALLVEKSLIRLADNHYYDIHELLRQFAFDQLSEAGDTVLTRDAHLNYYVALTSNSDSHVHGQQQTEWLDRLEREHDNLRTAINWALEQNTPTAYNAGLSLGASLWEFWLIRGHITEGRQWLERLLAATPDTISLARGAVTQGAGYLAYIQGEYDRAEALHLEGLAMRRSLNDQAGMGGSLSNLGIIAWSRGNFEAARDYYEQALAARRAAQYWIGVASVLTNLSLLLQDQGEYTDAIAYAEEALGLFTQLDDLQGKAHILFNLGSMTYDQGNWAQARALQEEALTLTRALGDRRMTGALLQNLGQTIASLGDRALAHTYLDESLHLLTESGDKTQVALVKNTMARLALREARLTDAQALIDESLALFQGMSAQVYFGQTLIIQGDIYCVRLQWDAAQENYQQALAIFLKSKNLQPAIEALYQLARVVLAQQQPTCAVILASAADALAQRLKLYTPVCLSDEERAAPKALLGNLDFDHAVNIGQRMDAAALAEYIANYVAVGENIPNNL